MKNLLTLIGLFMTFAVSAQSSYFTIYNFTVSAENVSTVYNLMDDYFSENRPDGVTVTLYENHFSDSENPASHAVVFSGSLDAMGAMYSGAQNTEWDLFRTRVDRHIDESISSAMGSSLASFGDGSTPHPIQKYYLLEVEDGGAFTAAYEKYHSAHNPDGVIVSMGNITAGQSSDGVNRWAIQGFQDFKSAMGGTSSLRNESEQVASDKAWDERRAAQGEVRLVRSGLRIQLGRWQD